MKHHSSDQLPELPGDHTASAFAYTAAATGVAGVATLAAMYAIEVPKGGPYIFGTTNDALGGFFNLLAIPVILQVHRRLPANTGNETLKWVVVAASVAGSVSSFLLVFGVLEFMPSTIATVSAMTVQALWFLLAHRQLLKRPDFPRGFGRLGRFIGAALLIGLPLTGLGYVLPGPDALRWTVTGLGVALGATGWVLWPYWYFRAGRLLSHVHATTTAGSPAPQAG
ncbi:hypothetical protein BIU82_04455 [Arthrobacter sp. SW1]|uniref:hypothetical protein n=1 Tax=Arthrobacter sp. SW1 TaxID=1920889 RepID=UPI000877DB7A|nr:hypothetical protein [Arthrobacter sp. SW1]OFI38577.1 hypothetical protein BIU82_04455 [Arthrobacter sp. SW1]